MKLFLRHSKNFLNFYLREREHKFKIREGSMNAESQEMNNDKMSNYENDEE